MAYDAQTLARLRDALKARKNKAALARKIGVSRPVLYDFLAGSTPDLTTLNALFEELDVDPASGLSNSIRVMIREDDEERGLTLGTEEEMEYPKQDVITRSEYRLVLELRQAKAKAKPALARLRHELGASSLRPDEKIAVLRIIERKYIQAIELLSRLAQAH